MNTHDLDGARRVMRDGVRHAPHEKPRQALPAVRAHHDEVGVPTLRIVEDDARNIAVFNGRGDHEADRAELVGGLLEELLRTRVLFVLRKQDVRIPPSTGRPRQRDREWFDDVQEAHVRSLDSNLSCQKVGRRLRAFRIVECDQDIHGCLSTLPSRGYPVGHIHYLGIVLRMSTLRRKRGALMVPFSMIVFCEGDERPTGPQCLANGQAPFRIAIANQEARNAQTAIVCVGRRARHLKHEGLIGMRRRPHDVHPP